MAAFVLAAGLAISGAGAAKPADLSLTQKALDLVRKGAKSRGIVACVACHRADGEGDAGSAFGRLTGHTAVYLEKQLRDYRSGQRENRVMQVIARAMTDVEIKALAAYYAGLRPKAKQLEIPAAPARGRELAEKGDDARAIPACLSCHGVEARSADPTMVNLNGQHANYIRNQLRAWQTGARKNDDGHVMATIAKQLSTDDILAVAIYFARRARVN